MSDQENIDKLITNARYGKLDKVKELIEEGVSIDGKESRGYDRTALHVATLSGKIDIMEYLIDKGSNLLATDAGTYNPLTSVIEIIDIDDNELYRLSKPQQRFRNQDENGKYVPGKWVDEDRPEKLQENENRIIEINEVRKKRVDAIKLLLEKAKEKNVLNDILTQKDYVGLNAIQLSYRGPHEIIQLLLDYEADPKDILHKTYFAERVDENVLKLLMEYAIKDPNYKPNEKAHQRVKDMFDYYKELKEEKDKITDDVAKKNKIPEGVSEKIKSFFTGSGKSKSRKSKSKKSVKKRLTKRNKKSKK